MNFAHSLCIVISSNSSISDSTQKLTNSSVFRTDYAGKINIFRNKKNEYIGADKVNREHVNAKTRIRSNKKKEQQKRKREKMKQLFRPKHFLVCDIMRDIFALR